MDGENNGKPYEQMDDLGVPFIFWKYPYQQHFLVQPVQFEFLHVGFVLGMIAIFCHSGREGESLNVHCLCSIYCQCGTAELGEKDGTCVPGIFYSMVYLKGNYYCIGETRSSIP